MIIFLTLSFLWCIIISSNNIFSLKSRIFAIFSIGKNFLIHDLYQIYILTNNPPGDIKPKEIIRYLVCLQFYYGDDKIYGRTKDLYEYIPNSGLVIDDFINILFNLLHFIDTEEYRKFLDIFNTEIHPIPTESLYNKFLKNLEELGEFRNQVLIINEILGKPLSHIHTSCF